MTSPLDRLRPSDRALVREAALPDTAPAMLATLTEDRFDDPAWIYERKLDGVRCLARRDEHGRVVLHSRNDKDMTGTYPEIAAAVGAQASTSLLVDGEVVAFEGRRTSFEKLQGRIGRLDGDGSSVAVFYYLYDVLFVDGADVRAVPQLTRKRLLRAVFSYDDPLRFTVHRLTGGIAMYQAACRRGDEGVIAKRADAPYASGRSKDWLKFKCVRDQEFVVGGWTDPKGSRSDLGALLVGYHDGDDVVYAGKVGTGFTAAVLRELAGLLAPLGTDSPTFTRNLGAARREKDVHWVTPEVVVQIGFSEWTRDGMLRHPRYQGLRTDKSPADVVRESR